MNFDSKNERRRSGKYVDFTINVEDASFPVHKVVLDAGSEYFRTMFNAEMKEKEENCCHLHDVTSLVVSRVLDFMYGEELILDSENILDILNVCHMWQLDPGVEKCEDFLVGNLAVENLIPANKLSKLYELKRLREKYTEFIIRHPNDVIQQGGITELEVEDMLNILVASRDKDISACNLWRLCSEWGKLRRGENLHVCSLVQQFPVKKFQVTEILEAVWKDDHITRCEGCKDNVARRILQIVHPLDFTDDNCIHLKLLSKAFRFEAKEKLADEYILQNHKKIFTSPSFLDLEEGDVLKYVTSINGNCSAEEFRGLVHWMLSSPGREQIFPKIFGRGSHGRDSQFLIDIRELCSRDLWIIATEDCFHVKKLAEKYNAATTSRNIDLYIATNFSEASEMPEFTELPLNSVTAYLREANLKQRWGQPSHWVLWNAAMRWISADLNRRRHFLELLEALPLHEFSLEFMKETVMECGLFSEPDVYLTKIVLDRAMKSEKKSRGRDYSDMYCG